jgi:hypothetical protein
VPGTAALTTRGFAEIVSVSCVSAGTCSADGDYSSRTGDQAFVVSQAHGTWGKAIEVPGIAALHGPRGRADIASVSCASAGNCSAGGDYSNSSDRYQSFVVSQAHGTWGEAIEVPSTATLNTGGTAGIGSVSCASAGNSSAGGSYVDSSGHGQAVVVSQAHGAWGKAIEVPGTAALNTGGGAGIDWVSCASAGHCSAGGSYHDSSGEQVFVVSKT